MCELLEPRKVLVTDILDIAALIELSCKEYLIETNINNRDYSRITNKREYAKLIQGDATPKIGIALLYNLANEIIDINSAWCDVKIGYKSWVPFLKREYKDSSEINGFIHSQLMEFIQGISLFIGDDEWSMHFIKLNGRDLIIEKCGDYRAYQWTKENEKA